MPTEALFVNACPSSPAQVQPVQGGWGLVLLLIDSNWNGAFCVMKVGWPRAGAGSVGQDFQAGKRHRERQRNGRLERTWVEGSRRELGGAETGSERSTWRDRMAEKSG